MCVAEKDGGRYREREEGREGEIEGWRDGGKNRGTEGGRREKGGKREDRKRMVRAFLTF